MAIVVAQPRVFQVLGGRSLTHMVPVGLSHHLWPPTIKSVFELRSGDIRQRNRAMSKLQFGVVLSTALMGLVLGDRPPPPSQYQPQPRYPQQHQPQRPQQHPTYPQPSHYPQPKYQELCKLKEWSSDTELCTPSLPSVCEQDEVKVFKLGKGQRKCIKVKIPKCKVVDEAEEIELCKMTVENRKEELEAKMYEQEMRKKCDTHYTTQCKPSYDGSYPKCTSVPSQICYDVPKLQKVIVPITVEASNIKTECKSSLVPTPKSKCWEEEEEFCVELPELKEKEEFISRCAPDIGEEECKKDTFHANHKSPLDFHFLGLKIRGHRRMDSEERGELIVVQRMDVVVDGIAGQFHLGEAKMDGGSLGYVHDLALGREDKDESIQGLKERAGLSSLHELTVHAVAMET
eukprot:maker-scaffold260_size234135-snap-gene-0.10 protein:Tk09534 transcript:maker-scaffold260_size234135-snap-gene-0.10-mRNA-1 annotation:"hypothetical protein"